MFSLTERPGNTRRPSGTCEIPSRTIASGPRPVIDLPSNRISPEQGHHLTFFDADRDAAQGFDLAIKHDQIVDLEQRHYSVPR
jgi:hypothetical protein